MTSPLRIGITGGIGAGKSIVCEVFKLHKIPVYDADGAARRLINTDQFLRKEIINLFGTQAYVDNKLDNKFVGKIAFNNPEKLDLLNKAVHPRVGKDYDAWAGRQSSAYTLKEAALLFETGSYKHLDKVILVSAPTEVRIDRVLKRDPHRSVTDIEAIMNKQWPESKKADLADFIVVNDNHQMVIPQVLEIHQKILELANGEIRR